MSSNENQTVTIKVSDGTEMQAYRTRPSAPGRYPGLMLFQEAFGVNAHIRDVAGRFAREGYVVMAPELFHRAQAGFEGRYDDFPSARRLVQTLTNEGLEADARATLEALSSDANVAAGQIACAGFCLGGRASFLANAALPVKAAISFYGGGIAPNQAGPGLLGRSKDLHAPALLFWGLLDKHIGIEAPRAVADAMREAGKRFVNVEFSDGDHGFFCDDRASYNPAAAAQSWVLSLQFLKTHLGKQETGS